MLTTSEYKEYLEISDRELVQQTPLQKVGYSG